MAHGVVGYHWGCRVSYDYPPVGARQRRPVLFDGHVSGGLSRIARACAGLAIGPFKQVAPGVKSATTKAAEDGSRAGQPPSLKRSDRDAEQVGGGGLVQEDLVGATLAPGRGVT